MSAPIFRRSAGGPARTSPAEGRHRYRPANRETPARRLDGPPAQPRTQSPTALLLVLASRHRACRQLSSSLATCAQWPLPAGPVADVPDAWGTPPIPPTDWPWPRLANHRPRCRRLGPVGTTRAASGRLGSGPSPRQRTAGGSFAAVAHTSGTDAMPSAVRCWSPRPCSRLNTACVSVVPSR